MMDEALYQRLAALIPGGELIVVEGRGHDIHVDKPEPLIGPVAEVIGQMRNKER
jgi:pimeloyl-ACP methyl ester carboxylesterase